MCVVHFLLVKLYMFVAICDVNVKLTLSIPYLYSVYTGQNNLNRRHNKKTEPITAGTDAPVRILFTFLAQKPDTLYKPLHSAPAATGLVFMRRFSSSRQDPDPSQPCSVRVTYSFLFATLFPIIRNNKCLTILQVRRGQVCAKFWRIVTEDGEHGSGEISYSTASSEYSQQDF